MSRLFISFFLLGMAFSAYTQQVLWANGYDITETNEVAAVALDTLENAYITGVYSAPFSLPYTGDAYIAKTNAFGDLLWTETLTGNVNIGDMVCLDENPVIVGQSNGPFVYKEISYGPEGYFFFIFKIDGQGMPEWQIFDAGLYGVNARIEAGKLGDIAVYTRGQYNLGDWIIILNGDGEELNSRLLSNTATTIVDMAYFNNYVYLNGILFGTASLLIDTVFIQQPPLESASFVLALNSDLVAEWVVVDTAFNNNDGKIVANNTAVYSYSSVLQPPFNLVNTIKKISHEGELLDELEVPLFSNAVSHYPDMASTLNHVALFVNNDFSFNSHKVMLFNHNLVLEKEFIIDGASDLYSGCITNLDNDLFIAHVYTDDLYFNEELTLTYNGTGKNPYISRIGEPTITGNSSLSIKNSRFELSPNPGRDLIKLSLGNDLYAPLELQVVDLSGQIKLKTIIQHNQSNIDVSQLKPGVYVVFIQSDEGILANKKLIIQ